MLSRPPAARPFRRLAHALEPASPLHTRHTPWPCPRRTAPLSRRHRVIARRRTAGTRRARPTPCAFHFLPFPLPCVLGLHSHCKHASPGRRPRKPAAHPISTQSRDRSGRVAWTLGCACSLRRLDHAHTLMHTPADVIRCSALPCPALPCPALPCLVAAIATGTGHGAIFFFCFFFLPFLVWLGRCVNAVGEGIGAVLARVGKQSGSRMLGGCSSCCGMCEAGLFVVVYSETNSLVSDREHGQICLCGERSALSWPQQRDPSRSNAKEYSGAGIQNSWFLRSLRNSPTCPIGRRCVAATSGCWWGACARLMGVNCSR
jgi:hypothetical protein